MRPLTSKPSKKQLLTDLDAVRSLAASRGWALALEALAQEEEMAIRALTENRLSTREELDFIRASLRAMRTMRNLPELMHAGIESELRLAPDDPPKEKRSGT